MITQETLDSLEREFNVLYDDLKSAYWAASTADGKDQIQGAKDLVDEVLGLIDLEELEADNAAIVAFTAKLKDSMKDLADLRTKLDGIVHNVAVVTQTIQGIDTALTAAEKIVTLAMGA